MLTKNYHNKKAQTTQKLSLMMNLKNNVTHEFSNSHVKQININKEPPLEIMEPNQALFLEFLQKHD